MVTRFLARHRKELLWVGLGLLIGGFFMLMLTKGAPNNPDLSRYEGRIDSLLTHIETVHAHIASLEANDVALRDRITQDSMANIEVTQRIESIRASVDQQAGSFSQAFARWQRQQAGGGPPPSPQTTDSLLIACNTTLTACRDLEAKQDSSIRIVNREIGTFRERIALKDSIITDQRVIEADNEQIIANQDTMIAKLRAIKDPYLRLQASIDLGWQVFPRHYPAGGAEVRVMHRSGFGVFGRGMLVATEDEVTPVALFGVRKTFTWYPELPGWLRFVR